MTQDKAAAKDIKAILAAARRRETVVRVCMAGDLAADADRLTAELDRIDAELERLDTTPRASLADGGRRAELEQARKGPAAELETVRELMLDAEVEFRFRALPPEEYSSLVAEHPSDNENMAFETKTFAPALVAASCIDPVMGPEDVAELWKVLTFGDRSVLWEAAYQASRSDAIQVPTSRAASVTPSSSDAK